VVPRLALGAWRSAATADATFSHRLRNLIFEKTSYTKLHGTSSRSRIRLGAPDPEILFACPIKIIFPECFEDR
jgi:hypothetical protein